MRKFVLLFAPATLALLPLIACENDSNGNGGLSFDGGNTGFDAPTSELDGAIPDGGPDVAPDAPVVPAVSVRILDSRGPKAGVRVVWNDATGAVIETKLTGADGKAVHVGTDATTASALLGTEAQHHIVTWTGVQTGDELQMRDDDSDETLGLYNVTVLGFADSGTNYYRVDGPCGGDEGYGTAAALPLRRDCAGAQNAVLATARSWQSGLTGHAFKKGNPPVADGGTLAINLGEWKAPASFVSTVTNVPDGTYVENDLLEIADNAGFPNATGQSEGQSTEYRIADGFADSLQATAAFGSYGKRRTITKRFAPAATVALDYAALLPSVDGAELDTADPRRPVISWTGESLAATDGGLVRFAFSVGGEEASYDWTFVVAPGTTSVTAPVMPPEADGFLPPIADAGKETYFYRPEVLFLEADVITSYAIFRGLQGALFGTVPYGFGGYALPALPTNGTYRTTSWTQMLTKGPRR